MANGLPSGIRLQMLLSDPEYWDKDGNMYVDPKNLEWADTSESFVMSDSTQCEHCKPSCPFAVQSSSKSVMSSLG